MKLLYTYLLLIVSIFSNAQVVQTKTRFYNNVQTTITVTEKSLVIKLNEKNKNFNDAFVLLLEKKLNKKIENYLISEKANIMFDKKSLKISNLINSAEVIFSFLDSKQDNYIKVLGISRFQGNFNDNEQIKFNPYIGEVISNQSIVGRIMSCTAGGPGSSQCGVSSEILGVMTQCEVSCNNGYYSCCDDGIGKCVCVPNNQKPPKSPISKISNENNNLVVSLSKDKILNIKNAKNSLKISIYSIDGIMKFSSDINVIKNSFDINNLQNGIYYYTITDSIDYSKKIKQGKIIIQ